MGSGGLLCRSDLGLYGSGFLGVLDGLTFATGFMCAFSSVAPSKPVESNAGLLCDVTSSGCSEYRPLALLFGWA